MYFIFKNIYEMYNIILITQKLHLVCDYIIIIKKKAFRIVI